MDDFRMDYEGEGINDINNNYKATVFPNPATDKITIKAAETITGITISDLLGKNVYTNSHGEKTLDVNIKTLPRGIYIVKVNGRYTGKFQKE